MSKYTTGEIAKLCDVSVRTVQYYHGRGILLPSQLSEGGRRLYGDEDVEKLRIICFLRELDLPIDSIKQILQEAHPEEVISLLLEKQELSLRTQLQEKQAQLEKILGTRRALRQIAHFSLDSIGDIAHIMENKRQLRTLHTRMLVLGFVMDAIEVSTLMIGILRGIWWPFGLGLVIVIGLGIYISLLYYKNILYICPGCHSLFRPRLSQSLWARHTPHTRNLTCTRCGHHGFCVETYGKDDVPC